MRKIKYILLLGSALLSISAYADSCSDAYNMVATNGTAPTSDSKVNSNPEAMVQQALNYANTAVACNSQATSPSGSDKQPITPPGTPSSLNASMYKTKLASPLPLVQAPITTDKQQSKKKSSFSFF